MNSRVFGFLVGVASLAMGIVVQACQSEPQNSPTMATGTETNWLRSCTRDAECGALVCECGVCTRRCSDAATCNLDGAVCSPGNGAAVEELCTTSANGFNLCLPKCTETCTAGQNCVAGACIPTRDAASSNESSSDVDATSESPSLLTGEVSSSDENEGDTSGSSLSSGSTNDASSVAWISTLTSLDAQTTDATSIDAGITPDANLGCPLDTRPLSDGCCYLDTDCEAGQVCYQAACSGDVTAPGTCATPPTAPGCYTELDCNADEVCQEGLVAQCGTTGAHTLGTCAPDCEYDLCHPERCDEVGEVCCDPLPGDGPNYCNADLECNGATCAQRAETTTPEALEREACEGTGGTWDYQSCGHYVCDQAPNCAAIIPGCDCGLGRSFDTLGCFDDPQCTSP